MAKQLRLSDLVRNSGRPQIVTLWTEPTKDKAFARAIKENRVLTIIQESSKQRDYGVLGFHQHAHASYFVFPRPLPKEGRVIGINYALVAEPEPTDPVPSKPMQPKTQKQNRKPKEKEFSIRIRQTATVEREIKVKAPDVWTAETRALESAKKKPFSLSDAEVHDEVVRSE
jgi:hypothetical protein